VIKPQPPSNAIRKQKKISSVLPQFKKYSPSRNLKFDKLGIFQSLKFRILIEKNPNFS